ncbi:hypothetical protein BJX99DRAFT_264091 [Aspergillus californicus]
MNQPGAGPSGLVTAKTLLRNFPPGTFAPTIFEVKSRVGGLWGVDYPEHDDDHVGDGGLDSHSNSSSSSSRGLIDPYMRTNLSRFSVAFSDLSWESVFGGSDDQPPPVFPRAWQVRKYLEKYVETFILHPCLRLGCRVISADRCSDSGSESGFGGRGWKVQWASESDPEIVTENFEFLVIASGHFGAPHIPDLPGLEKFHNTVHSSGLQNPGDIDRLLEKSPKGGKLVVIGGSMSGVEAAASLALHVSSINFKPGSSGTIEEKYEVWHVGTSPFWVLPTRLPHQYSKDPVYGDEMPYLPLDLFLYDIDRRPPGDFAYGAKTPQQIEKIYQAFRNMLGEEYGKIAGVNISNDQGGEKIQPPWVAISDSYAEFVRSEAIKVKTGKACLMNDSKSGLGTIVVQKSDDTTLPLKNVAAIVLATGFTPSKSLSFLSKDILSTLEYSPEDTFLPLILDGCSSSHGEIPDIGFVGFYRGAFWGPAELQAQSLAQQWNEIDVGQEISSSISDEERMKRAQERQAVRDFRNTCPSSVRGQFPLGDYVGLMEALAKKNGLDRLPIWGAYAGDQAGPMIPARYPPKVHHGDMDTRTEAEGTMHSLRGFLHVDSTQTCVTNAAVIFRALHGKWTLERTTASHDCIGRGAKVSGTATFHPRYPSNSGFEKEYLCEESIENGTEQPTRTRSIYELREDTSPQAPESQIRIWSTDQSTDPNKASELIEQVAVEMAARVDDLDPRQGQFVIRAETEELWGLRGTRYEYAFSLDRVAIKYWVCTAVGTVDGEQVELSRTWYRR